MAASASNKRRLDLETTSSKRAKIDSFFTSKSITGHSSFNWLDDLNGTCLHGINLNPNPSPKVAAFDLDGTLIQANFGQVQWSWWRDCVPEKLKLLHDEGFAIVIVSNQGYPKSKVMEWRRKKIPSIAAALPDVPFRIFGASEKDQFRKPIPGIWTALEKIYAESGISIDKAASFFVGDAAGRPGDHSGTDRKWASNVGLRFYTPQEYFLGTAPAAYTLKGFHVDQLREASQLFEPTSSPLVPQPPVHELILLVGLRCVGKSTFYHRHLQPIGYTHIDQQASGSRCSKILEDTLRQKQSCALELNINTTIRKKYIRLAAQLGVRVRCFYFKASKLLANHNNLYRAFNLPASVAAKEPKHSFVADIGSIDEPSLDEGFYEIKTINWKFEGTEEERRHWSMWLTLASKE